MRPRIYLESLAIALVILTLVGCSQSNPVSTGFGSGGGYSINLGATSKSVPFGGSLALTATIKDAEGNIVQASLFPVTFTSELGGAFSLIQPQIASGIVSNIYVAPSYAVPKLSVVRPSVRAEVAVPTLPTSGTIGSSLPTVDIITMSYQGAAAKLSITLYKP